MNAEKQQRMKFYAEISKSEISVPCCLLSDRVLGADFDVEFDCFDLALGEQVIHTKF